MVDIRGGAVFLIQRYITEEDLSGQVDGINKLFTISNPYVSGTTRTFLNGMRQQKGILKDLQEISSTQLTFEIAPDVGDIILVDYIKS